MSKAEEEFALHLRADGIAHEREYPFAKSIGRKWRADFFVYPDLLVEIEGATYYGKNKDGSMRLGRHQTAKGFSADCEKYNAATLLGYRLLRYTPDMVSKGMAIEGVVKALSLQERVDKTAGTITYASRS